MQPTMEILERIHQNSKGNKNEVFTKLFRYLLRQDIYFVAYQNLYSNDGAATNGVIKDTADGFSEDKINKIIKSLSYGIYAPQPVRRTYIKKANGKQRPLGIPTFTDKLVQEVMRMILEAIYEPVFCETSHGFRPKRSCHTALKGITKGYNGTKWFVEGDIKGCFDNINHNVLVECINKKIKDARFTQLVYKFLKAGYMEDWKYNNTHSGTPQGGIISPVLANIYLHELDRFVERLKENFDKKSHETYTTEYRLIRNDVCSLRQRIKRAKNPRREALLKEFHEKRAIMLKTPCKSQTDKKLKYVRYADDFIIGVNGDKSDCEWIKAELTKFIAETLKMELSDEKTLITHSSEHARFLGYDLSVRRNSDIKVGSRNCTQRTLNNIVELNIPFQDKIMNFLFNNEVVKQIDGEIWFMHRPSLLRCTDLEILSIYNAELRGICNYYSLASNYNKLDYFAYLMEYSCLKTLANKHKSSISKIRVMYKDGFGKWAIPYETKTAKKKMYFAKFRDCKSSKYFTDTISNMAKLHKNAITSFEQRLKAKQCELCGTTEVARYEIHHINKVKNLSGKEQWERIMIAKHRKTMVLCSKCHNDIHQQ